MSDEALKRQPLALWAVPVPDLGGVARHVLDVARVGIPGWRLVVLCPEGALADSLRTQGAAVVTAPFGPDAGMRASAHALGRTAFALRPAIVHSHLAYADIISAWARLPRGTRRFTTEHGIAGDDGVYHHSGLHARIMAMVHRTRFRRFDGVIAVSRSTRATMIAKWRVRQPIEVIPNGVDRPADVAARTYPSSTLRILALSRLAPEKRIDRLIDAFALVKRERPDATLTIAGQGPLLDELIEQVRRLGLTDSVSFPGYVDAAEAMNGADVIAQLSVWENLSYTLLDAAVRGIRVVASDVGGNGEVVGPGSLVSSVDADSVAPALLSPTTSASVSPTLTTCPQMCLHIARFYSNDMENPEC